MINMLKTVLESHSNLFAPVDGKTHLLSHSTKKLFANVLFERYLNKPQKCFYILIIFICSQIQPSLPIPSSRESDQILDVLSQIETSEG